MSDLVFSIANTFSLDARIGALGQNEAKRFFIAPYQRGYKWGSWTSSSPVQVLMADLKDAFQDKSNEYYLQYITLSKAVYGEEQVLEVIDGQQRLTTLTLLFSVLGYRLKSKEQPFTNNLLSYEVRPKVGTFLQNFIYQNIETVLTKSWDDFREEHTKYDEQDIYYLYHAVQKINELLPADNLADFKDYVAEHVKLIVNRIEKTISCERIFANLNSNKVDLTSSELIKALFLTKSAREKNDDKKEIRFKEVMEVRSAMGRQWDEIERWADIPAIKSFYFDNSAEPVYELLLLLAIKDGFDHVPEDADSNTLFNYFQSRIKRGEKTAKYYFTELKKLKSILQNWFEGDQTHNLLGYLLSAKGASFKFADFISLTVLPKPEVLTDLFAKVKAVIPNDLKNLEYGTNDDELHRLLLALSVFTSDERFDFHAFQDEDWSLEHIFPQNPKKFPASLNASDITLINAILGDKLTKKDKSEASQKEVFQDSWRISLVRKLKLQKCELTPEEIETLCGYLKSDKLNSVGNMALLTIGVNSSIGNGMFNAKRMKIVRKVSDGKFVPKHTYDVFSKLISNQMSPDLSVWTENDIKAHNVWIQAKISEIIQNKFQL
jgi:hypothetical protein